MHKPLLILPIMLTLLVSGCTTPDVLCFIPGLCGQVVEETHDVIVIESLQALPNNVPPEGTIRLVAIVSNVADVDAEITKLDNIQVELYDYCEGLFSKISDAKQTINLLRGEKQQVEWTLQALPRTQVPVKTECTLKVRAKYPYTTKSITTLHLIDYAEMQRRINEGTYKEIGSYTSVGYGPIKPYITVEGTQPIPVEDNKINTVLSLQIKNRGKGFLSTENDTIDSTGPTIKDKQILLDAQDKDSMKIKDKLEGCIDNYMKANSNELKLIKGESTKIMCTFSDDFEIGKVPVESTKTIQASIGKVENGKPVNGYWYEFRKEIKVTVEPKF
jgi:hypothetical protein